MSKLDEAKALFDKIFSKAKIDLAEDAVIEEPKKGDERPDLEDGEHTEGDFIITVVDKVITEVKEKEKEDDKAKVEEEEDVVDPIEDPIEDPNEGLAGIIIEKLGLAGVDNGSFSIYGSIDNGKLSWGDVCTTDYKVLMAAQTEETEARKQELEDLKLQLECKDKVIVALSEDETVSDTVNLNPTEEIIDIKPMTQKEALRARL